MQVHGDQSVCATCADPGVGTRRLEIVDCCGAVLIVEDDDVEGEARHERAVDEHASGQLEVGGGAQRRADVRLAEGRAAPAGARLGNRGIEPALLLHNCSYESTLFLDAGVE